jgi:hypothetical protein
MKTETCGELYDISYKKLVEVQKKLEDNEIDGISIGDISGLNFFVHFNETNYKLSVGVSIPRFSTTMLFLNNVPYYDDIRGYKYPRVINSLDELINEIKYIQKNI